MHTGFVKKKNKKKKTNKYYSFTDVNNTSEKKINKSIRKEKEKQSTENKAKNNRSHESIMDFIKYHDKDWSDLS